MTADQLWGREEHVAKLVAEGRDVWDVGIGLGLLGEGFSLALAGLVILDVRGEEHCAFTVKFRDLEVVGRRAGRMVDVGLRSEMSGVLDGETIKELMP